MAAGHVYILVNPVMPGFLKIGMTERTPEERAREVSQGTGVAVPYAVAYSEQVPDCALAERLIHNHLDGFRVNRNREFFHLPLKDAIQEMARIAEEVRRSVPFLTQSTSGTQASVSVTGHIDTEGPRATGVPIEGERLRVRCPTCNTELEIDAVHAGQEVECGSCLQVFVADAPGGRPPYRTRRSDEDDDRPRPRRRPRRDDDDDNDDRPRRRGYDDDIPPKSRLAYILLAIFFGGLGVHNFYAGRTGPAVGQLCLALFNITMIVLAACTFGLTLLVAGLGLLAKFVWVVVELCVVDRDGDGRPMAS